ncbi:MAG: M1 family aminopeptidase [Bacteroidia bacterium]
MRKNVIYLFIFSAALACSPKYNVDVPEITVEANAPDTTSQGISRPIYREAEKRINDLQHTKLEVSFDWKKRYLYGKAEITLKPHFYPTDSLTLDAKGMDIKKVSIKGGQDLKYTYDNWFLRIDLSKTYTKNDSYTIYIEYTAKPDELNVQGSDAITDAKGLYFVNPDSTDAKKPTQIWTQGETEASSCWFPTIDAPNQKTTQEIFITVDKRYKTLSNGLLLSSKENGNGTRTDHWRQALPHTPYLFMMAIGDFAIVKDQWKRKDGSVMEVGYYLEHEYEPHARAIFGKTPKMIEYFSNLLNVEYPWEKYDQVIVRDYVSGAMENTGAVINGEFYNQTTRETIDGNNESTIAHELFHHWFGDLVTCESWSNLPLNESFANYSQYLWDEYEYGRFEADMNAYDEMQGYILSSQNTGYKDLIRFDYGDKEEMFDGHSYNKGGRILHMLRNHVGDEAFFTSLNLYLTQNKFKAAEIHDLRLAFEEVTGEDLNWFFNQWFLDKGHPVVEFSQSFDESTKILKVTIKQNQNFDKVPLYKLPIAIDVYNYEKAQRFNVVADEVEKMFEFTLDYTPTLVNIDADKVLLCEKEDIKPNEQWVNQLKYAPLWLDKNEAFDALAKENVPSAHLVYLNLLDHEHWDIKVMAMKASKSALTNYGDAIKKKLINIAQNDKKSIARGQAIRHLSTYFESDKSLETVYENALKDSSYFVLGEALSAYAAMNPEKSLTIAKSLENEKGSSIRNAIAKVYVKHGTAEQHDFFLNAIDNINGFGKYQFLQTYHTYLMKQSDTEIDKGVAKYKDVAANASPWFVKLAGYQLLNATKGHYQQKASSTTDNAEKAVYSEKANDISASINSIKEKETDSQVLQYLKQILPQE